MQVLQQPILESVNPAMHGQFLSAFRGDETLAVAGILAMRVSATASSDRFLTHSCSRKPIARPLIL